MMRERRRDFCKVLRECNGEDLKEKEEEEEVEVEDEDVFEDDEELVYIFWDEVIEEGFEDVFKKLLFNLVNLSDEFLLLFKVFVFDLRIYMMLMKGYMKNGCVVDIVRMFEVMRC